MSDVRYSGCCEAYRAEGAAGLISKRRGRASNRAKPEDVRTKALAIIRERYWDFGPTLAAEKLGELHGIALGRETLRQWMIEDGLWLDRKQRLKRVHQPRPRRECVGELVQIDGCEHWWFEDRGPQCTLLVFVDDATSRLMHLQFVESELTFSYFHATRAYLEAWGKPVAFYSDKHGVFRVNHEGATGGDGMTQFGRALTRSTSTSSAPIRARRRAGSSGRTRPCRTGWSRSCGLLARRDLAAGNALLPAFMADYNARFAKPPANGKDLHRPLRAGDDLEDAFAWKEERTLSRALTLQYDKVIFVLEPSDQAKAAIGKRVTVVDYPDGRLSIRYKGIELAYRTFDKLRQVSQAEIVENKRLGAVLAVYPRATNRTGGDPQQEGTAPPRSTRRASVQSRLSLSTSRARLALARYNNGCRGEGRAAVVGQALRFARAPRPPAARTRRQ